MTRLTAQRVGGYVPNLDERDLNNARIAMLQRGEHT